MATTLRISFLIMLLLPACVDNVGAGSRGCTFAYNDDIRNKLVVPAMRKDGENFDLYDLERPGIVFEGRNVSLGFLLKSVSVVDGPIYYVVIDSCTSRIVSSAAAASGYITGAPKD